jgi:hypothetical protein
MHLQADSSGSSAVARKWPRMQRVLDASGRVNPTANLPNSAAFSDPDLKSNTNGTCLKKHPECIADAMRYGARRGERTTKPDSTEACITPLCV